MAHNFIACDRDQPMLLPPDLRDWLAEDHLAWFLDAVSADERVPACIAPTDWVLCPLIGYSAR